MPESFITNQWEEEMLSKYQDLFQFPLDTSINDRTMILLVLAYQMNSIRSWCELGDGVLAKVILFFLFIAVSLIFFIVCALFHGKTW